MKKYSSLILLAVVFAACELVDTNRSVTTKADSQPVSASTVETMNVSEGNLITFKVEDEDIKKAIEPSGIVAVDNDGKFFLVIDDKSENLRIVNEAGEFVSKIKIKAANLKPKWEGIAKDDDGFFYVIGSHAGDKKEKIINRSSIFRFRLIKDDANGSFKIDESEQKPVQFAIKNELVKLKLYSETPAENKVKIEGLAIKNINGKKNLIIGMREPVGSIQIYSAEFPADLTELVNLPLQPYFRFDAGKTADGTPYKLSSIEYVAQLNGFLVLTSSETTIKAPNDEAQPVFHGNGLWLISDEKIASSATSEGFKVVEAQKVKDFQIENKAEGICLIPDATKLRFAVVYDNDTEDFTKALPTVFSGNSAEKQKYLGKMQVIKIVKNSSK